MKKPITLILFTASILAFSFADAHDIAVINPTTNAIKFINPDSSSWIAESNLTTKVYYKYCSTVIYREPVTKKNSREDQDLEGAVCLAYTSGIVGGYTHSLTPKESRCYWNSYPAFHPGEIIRSTMTFLKKNPKYINNKTDLVWLILNRQFTAFPIPKKCLEEKTQ